MADETTRIEALERRIADLEATVEALIVGAAEPRSLSSLTTPPPPPPGAVPIDPTPQPPAPPMATVPHRAAPSVDSETVLKWGGIGLVVLAVGFAVNTAIQRGWIGPELQLAGALGIAAALIAAGLRLRPTRPPWTHALCSGGVAVLFITFASNLFTDLTGDDLAHVLTVVSLVVAIALARFVPSAWTAAVAVVGSVAGWLVISGSDGPFIESGAAFVIGFVLVIAVAVERRWVGVRLLTVVLGLVLTLAFAAEADTDADRLAALLAAVLVAVTLVVVPSLPRTNDDWRSLELRLPTVLSPWAWVTLAVLFVEGDDNNRSAGLLALATTVAVLLIAQIGRTRLDASHRIALLVGASVTLTAGVGLLLDVEFAWVAVAVQGVGLLVLARTLGQDWLIILNAAALLVASALFVAVDGAAAWGDDTGLLADIARIVAVVVLAVAAWLAPHRDLRRVGALAVLVLLMISLGSALVHLPQGQAAVSLSWAVMGIGVLVAGALRKLPDLGNVGLAVLAVTVAKLLLVDMAEVDALWRAGLFLVVGLALMRLGFLLPSWTATDDGNVESTLVSHD